MTTTFHLKGDFTTEKALEYKAQLNALALQNSELHVDLSEVETVDIVGINALATTHKLLKEKGGSFSVSLKKSSELYHLLHLTKFTEIFTLKYL